MDVFMVVGEIASITSVALLIFFRNTTQKYVDEKAKNLATIQDIGEITNEIEKVKTTYLQRSHAWKQIFEKEYELLREIWGAAWEFQAAIRSLKPVLDTLPEDKKEELLRFEERGRIFNKSAKNFEEVVLKTEPFVPPDVYSVCILLREHVVDIVVEIEEPPTGRTRPDPKTLISLGRQLDDDLEKLKLAIRDHIHTKLSSCE